MVSKMGFKCRPVVGSRAKTAHTWASMTVENVPLSGWGGPERHSFPWERCWGGLSGTLCVSLLFSFSFSLLDVGVRPAAIHRVADRTKPPTARCHEEPAATHRFQVPAVSSNKTHPPRPTRRDPSVPSSSCSAATHDLLVK